ncbi:CXADR-like membrane protein [Xiphias gladius]|uniref:CXADR-like membrane protein n=1 Tax=Xiphias gladius TaxID=8245 RepID=UPI001A9937BC|nr:CXADR-like membrane protein [Xiphias gladius]
MDEAMPNPPDEDIQVNKKFFVTPPLVIMADLFSEPNSFPSPSPSCAPTSPPLTSTFPLTSPSTPSFSYFRGVLLGVLTTYAQMEMKKVVGDNATLPCHHQFLVGDDPTLDIEWLLLKPTNRQRVVITYFAGRVFDPNEAEHGRVAFAGEYLKGDASLLIIDLSLTDSGEYSCKVKTGAQYHWSTISLIVLVKPSKPQCWMEGKLLAGSDVKMSCKSADGSDPIKYKWERVLDKGKYLGKLPPLAVIDLKNPEIVTLRNLTKESTGVYKCTASNAVGEESCTVEVKMHYIRGIGVVAGAVVGVSFGILLIILIIWLVCRNKEMKKYEEEETPNEIREDAEAPKAKLVKPNSLSSSRSGSSRSGTSSTQSMVHIMGPQGQRGCVPAVAALKENCQASTFPQSPPGYNHTVPKTPEPRSTPTSTSTSNSNLKPSPPPKLSPGNLTRMGATPVMIPAQTKAFQTV